MNRFYQFAEKNLQKNESIEEIEQPFVEEEIENKNRFVKQAENNIKTEREKFNLKDTAKDVGKQIASKGLSGFLGAHGNILNTLGLNQKQDLLPGQKARIELDDPYDLGLGDDIAPSYNRLPTSQDVNDLLVTLFGIGEGKTPSGRIAGNASEFIGSGLAMGPAGGAKGLLTLAGSGLAGQSLREAGAPESLATGVEIAGSIIPSVIQGRVAPTSKQAKSLTDAGRKLGLSEKQITPLIQNESKVAVLSKVARKGEGTKKQFASIKEKLGDSYNNIKSRPEASVKIGNNQQVDLTKKFSDIRNDLSKTLAPSPDKEAALNYIEKALESLRNVNATPEYLVNFWQDINKSVKWNSINGGKKALARLKEPISEILERTSPKLAKDFEMTNQLYSKYAQISKKLKPDLVDSFVNKGEILSIVPSGIALATGNPWAISALGSEVAIRTLATEMLTNPYFQNIGNKLVKNFNQGSVKGVTDLIKNAKEYMERKHPNENWDFLTNPD